MFSKELKLKIDPSNELQCCQGHGILSELLCIASDYFVNETFSNTQFEYIFLFINLSIYSVYVVFLKQLNNCYLYTSIIKYFVNFRPLDARVYFHFFFLIFFLYTNI